VALVLATSLQMAFLGAIISLSGRALYAQHLLTTAAWGLTPLQDQELGGALMWAPAGLILVATILTPLALVLRPTAERALGAPTP
jgi:putative membrane protein